VPRNNLAIVIRQYGKYAEAESLQRQTLELKEVLDNDHPSTLDSIATSRKCSDSRISTQRPRSYNKKRI